MTTDRMVIMVDVDVSGSYDPAGILMKLHEEFDIIRCAYVGKDKVRELAIAAFADDLEPLRDLLAVPGTYEPYPEPFFQEMRSET